jgi:hypothetical protein
MSNFDGKLPPFFFILSCSGQLEEQSWIFCTNLIGPIFFKSPRGKTPQKIAHVKLQKLMLGAESKLHAIFSADFISLHQGLLGKNYEQS